LVGLRRRQALRLRLPRRTNGGTRVATDGDQQREKKKVRSFYKIYVFLCPAAERDVFKNIFFGHHVLQDFLSVDFYITQCSSPCWSPDQQAKLEADDSCWSGDQQREKKYFLRSSRFAGFSFGRLLYNSNVAPLVGLLTNKLNWKPMIAVGRETNSGRKKSTLIL
jgi:hypothetical protein